MLLAPLKLPATGDYSKADEEYILSGWKKKDHRAPQSLASLTQRVLADQDFDVDLKFSSMKKTASHVLSFFAECFHNLICEWFCEV